MSAALLDSAPAALPPSAGLAADELILVGFAGGGGSSEGIKVALDQLALSGSEALRAVLARRPRAVDIAINHDPLAIAVHRANHPETEHHCQNIWQAKPSDVVGVDARGRLRKVGLAWFSPDCRHFSKAKGGKPVEKRIRDLAWVVIAYARDVRPRIIMLENVEEFQDWGPLLASNLPDPDKRGLEFRRWLKELKRLGYKVEWKELRACDYGSPTIRKRFFLIARCDGVAIRWPEPTHAAPDKLKPGQLPWRTAAECIDWSIPCPSIFLTREEGRAIGCNRPLADATMRRIARGVDRYVIKAAKPFLVPVTHPRDARIYNSDEPFRTATGAPRGEFAAVVPTMAPVEPAPVPGFRCEACGETFQDQNATGAGGLAPAECPKCGEEERVHPVAEPARTITTASRGEQALVAPYLVPRYGERPATDTSPGQEPRVAPADAPIATIVPTQNHGSLAAVHLTKFRTGATGSGMDEPAPTVTANSFVKRPGGAPPLGVVSAFLAQHNTGEVGHDARRPVSTIVQKGCTQSVVTSHLTTFQGTCKDGRPVDAPAATVTGEGWHLSEVRAFLMKYYGADQDPRLDEPMHTATSKARFGLVTVEGVDYQIVDIGMRMLRPRELYRAQGFPDTYVIDPIVDGKRLTKTAQIKCVGNSVCPDVAAALVRVNLGGGEPANRNRAQEAAD